MRIGFKMFGLKGKIGLTVLYSFSCWISSSFYEGMNAHSSRIFLVPNTRNNQTVVIESLSAERKKNPFLLAASTQLSNLLYNMSISATGIAREYKIVGKDYTQAYFLAYGEFYNIVGTNPVASRWTNTTGAIYTGNLIGGGTANLKDYGASLPLKPTIDIQNHNTPSLGAQSFSQIREVKFPYATQNNFCNVSTLSSC
jgi:hypothetical protein